MADTHVRPVAPAKGVPVYPAEPGSRWRGQHVLGHADDCHSHAAAADNQHARRMCPSSYGHSYSLGAMLSHGAIGCCLVWQWARGHVPKKNPVGSRWMLFYLGLESDGSESGPAGSVALQPCSGQGSGAG